MPRIPNFGRYLTTRSWIRRLALPALLFIALPFPFFQQIPVFKDTFSRDAQISATMALFGIVLIVIWDLIADSYPEKNLLLFPKAVQAQHYLVSKLDNQISSKKAIIIQHSLSYFKELLTLITQQSSINTIEIFMQHPDSASNSYEKSKIEGSVYDCFANIIKDPRIIIYFYTKHASFRGVLLENHSIISGSYIYMEPLSNDSYRAANTQIYGHNTPAMFIGILDSNFKVMEEYIHRVRQGLLHESINSHEEAGKALIERILSER